MTVTIEDPLWSEMQRHRDIRWSVVMKEAAAERLRAIHSLDRIGNKSGLSEEEIEEFSVKLGKKITGRK